MRRLLVSLVGLLALGGAATAPAAQAQTRTASCLTPAAAYSCTVWTGRVTWIDDGDTFRVDLDGDRTHSTVTVRITGVNAMEQTVYARSARLRRGECHAVEATARLEQLLRRSRWRVRLYALDASSESRRRWRRTVGVKVGGRWQDVGRKLLAEGHALWLSNSSEWVWNAPYSLLAERAAARRQRLWDPTYCGAGPSDASPLSVQVNADADGSDIDNVNGEWVRIRNLDPVNEVHLGGWWVRDSALNRYTFPEWATLPPGERLTVYVGQGTDTWTELFWGERRPVFENPRPNGRTVGDGAYLFDPQGDLRAWSTYPCRTGCTDRYQGAVRVTAKTTGREFAYIRNVASFAVDLDGYRLESPPYSYVFDRDSVLQPGEQMRIEVRGDPADDTRLEKHWGETGTILNNSGDVLRLSSLRGVVLDCFAFGDRTC
jgi:endonuclease YncB( thermonuclease family)